MEQILDSNVASNATMHKSKRMLEQDIAKGICILAVIVCHCIPLTEQVDVVLRTLLGYCMPFFFVMAGYNYRKGKRTPGQNIKRRAKQILWPLFIISTLIAVLFGAGLFIIKGTSVGVDFLKSYVGLWLTEPISSLIGFPTIGTYVNSQRIFEPYWFLLYLFTASIIFFLVVDKALENKYFMIITLTILVAASMIMNFYSLNLPWGIHNAPIIAALMLMGSLLSKYKVLEKAVTKSYKDVNFWVCFVLVVLSGVIAPRAGQITGSGQVTLILGTPEVLFTLIYAIFSTYFLIKLSEFIKNFWPLNKFFHWFGINSMTVFMVHLLYIGLAKTIIGAGLNTSLAFVEVMNIRDFAAYIIAIIFLSIHLCLQERIVNWYKRKKLNKKLLTQDKPIE